MKKLINIIYLYILKVLFHLFSFFANVSNGGRYFVKKKILIGTLIIAVSGMILSCQNENNESNKKTSKEKSMCYDTYYETLIKKNKDTINNKLNIKVETFRAPVISCYDIELIDTNQNDAHKIINENELTIYSVVEEQATYLGGEEELFKFIRENLIITKDSSNELIGGTFWIEFVVEKDGSMSNINIRRAPKPSYGMENEVMRVMSLMSEKIGWIPAKNNGKAVRSKMVLPIKIDYSK